VVVILFCYCSLSKRRTRQQLRIDTAGLRPAVDQSHTVERPDQTIIGNVNGIAMHETGPS
jgi:hypothetical protein